MNPRIENLRGYILRKEHHVLRRTPARLGLDNLNIGFAAAGMPPVRRSAEMLAALMRAEQPVILPLSLIHLSEPTRQAEISYAVFCLKKKKTISFCQPRNHIVCLYIASRYISTISIIYTLYHILFTITSIFLHFL